MLNWTDEWIFPNEKYFEYHLDVNLVYIIFNSATEWTQIKTFLNQSLSNQEDPRKYKIMKII